VLGTPALENISVSLNLPAFWNCVGTEIKVSMNAYLYQLLLLAVIACELYFNRCQFCRLFMKFWHREYIIPLKGNMKKYDAPVNCDVTHWQ
jgi:hypothetical protein